ncbi:hypothetical protein P9112_011802 [Eukaryota sp. TZLM1-RC]
MTWKKFTLQAGEISEVAQKVSIRDHQFNKEVVNQRNVLSNLESQYKSLVKENTARLKELNELLLKRNSMFEIMNRRNAKLASQAPVSAAKGGLDDLNQQKEFLKNKIQDVDMQISALSSEIHLLRRKDTFCFIILLVNLIINKFCTFIHFFSCLILGNSNSVVIQKES